VEVRDQIPWLEMTRRKLDERSGLLPSRGVITTLIQITMMRVVLGI